MGLFKPDLYRSFAVGFVLGAALLAGFMGSKDNGPIAGQVIPSATAAPAMPDQTLVEPGVLSAR
jgi:hypothetical protein